MQDFLRELGLEDANRGVYAGAWLAARGSSLDSICPSTGERIAVVEQASKEDYDKAVEVSQETFLRWRMTPAPVRGQYVREIGNILRAHKEPLGKLISHEMGKILTEGEGEVQEMIDIADFAVGLSRQLYGLVMQSERPEHRMMEQWHPLGPVGIITSFNFPGAVWAWNAMIAAVCGDTMIWKPSSQTPLTAVATQHLVNKVMQGTGFEGVFSLTVGGSVGRSMAQDPRLPLISFTGSTPVGREVGKHVAGRFGKSILELGGNNAVIVMEDADLDMTLRAVLFGAVGTTGQRCTTTRRVFLQKEIVGKFTDMLLGAYPSIPIGDALDSKTLVGPLVNAEAVEDYAKALETIVSQGGEILVGGKCVDRPGFFVEPTVVRARADMDIVCHETFVPILYLIEFSDLDEAIAMHNAVPQGLSSALFTTNLRTADVFLSARGSDCGIANINIGTSGAEIGGAFGGEKETGGGRESGSDAWKAYMRRQTNTVNWGTELPLAQGVKFDI